MWGGGKRRKSSNPTFSLKLCISWGFYLLLSCGVWYFIIVSILIFLINNNIVSPPLLISHLDTVVDSPPLRWRTWHNSFQERSGILAHHFGRFIPPPCSIGPRALGPVWGRSQEGARGKRKVLASPRGSQEISSYHGPLLEGSIISQQHHRPHPLRHFRSKL